MEKSVPNVSTIFRELSHLSSSSQIGMSDSRPHNACYPSSQPSQESSMEELYRYKQSRHAELMKKLHHSYNENRALLGYTQEQAEPIHNFHQALESKVDSYLLSDKGQSRGTNSSRTSWKPPAIKYRHIEDKNKEKEKLQRQFYGNRAMTQQEEPMNMPVQGQVEHYPNENSRETKDIHVDDMESNAGRSVWPSKGSKYEEKIESYYELCKRTASKGLPSRTEQRPSKDTHRFERSKPNQNAALDLGKALSILES